MKKIRQKKSYVGKVMKKTNDGGGQEILLASKKREIKEVVLH